MSKALADHLIALTTNDLRPGMFVAALDRLWLHTPFPPDGFYLRDHKQIAKLRRFCTFVYIDPRKSRETTELQSTPFVHLPVSTLAPAVGAQSVGDEMPWARHAMDTLVDKIRQMIRDVRGGRLPDLQALKTGLIPAVDSIQRCPDALLWLIRMEPPAGYLYRRACGTAIIAAVYGYRLGFDQTAIRELALGGLLLDIGKSEVPVTIMAKPDALTDFEYGMVRKHVDHAQEMVRLMIDVPERVVEMVSSHHERYDGSGYPQQQRGAEIPLFARIAGIADTFDAMTQQRHYAPAVSAHTALRYLSGQRHAKFDDALLQEFIHAMGIYPTGTWVELLDGSVGIVCAQDAGWPLTPRIAVLLDGAGQRHAPHTVVANRANPIVRARHSGQPGLDAPDLEAIA
jgi:HD-GYP domain-containing protein (c-di-GMP phosphodiesterase class II)